MSNEGVTLDEMRGCMRELECTMDSLDKKQDVSMAEVKGVLGQMAQDVKYLLTAVRDGNGRAPMIVRVQMLERSIDALEKSVGAIPAEIRAMNERIETMGEKIDEVARKVTNPELAVESTRGKWMVLGAIVTALLGSIPGILALILK